MKSIFRTLILAAFVGAAVAAAAADEPDEPQWRARLVLLRLRSRPASGSRCQPERQQRVWAPILRYGPVTPVPEPSSGQ